MKRTFLGHAVELDLVAAIGGFAAFVGVVAIIVGLLIS